MRALSSAWDSLAIVEPDQSFNKLKRSNNRRLISTGTMTLPYFLRRICTTYVPLAIKASQTFTLIIVIVYFSKKNKNYRHCIHSEQTHFCSIANYKKESEAVFHGKHSTKIYPQFFMSSTLPGSIFFSAAKHISATTGAQRWRWISFSWWKV